MKLNKRQLDALGHILDNCRKAAEFTAGMTREQFENNGLVQYALTRCVEIIGEAANRLGPQFHSGHPEVPWRLMTGMRNRLIHGYDTVDVHLLWETSNESLPILLKQIEEIIRADDSRI